MAAPTTTDNYDEYVAKLVSGDLTQVDTINVGLYDDSTNQITSTDDMAAITSEPEGSGYATKQLGLNANSDVIVGADTVIDVVDQIWTGLSFDVSTPVDAYYISMSVQLAADASPTEHLMGVGTIDGGPYDLQAYTEFTVQDVGLTQTQG